MSGVNSGSPPVLLITGSSGYVGNHLLEFINRTFPSFIVYGTHFRRHTRPSIESRNIRYLQLNLSKDQSIDAALQVIFEEHNAVPSVIIHCAAVTSSGFCEKNMNQAMIVNCCEAFVHKLLARYKQIKISKNPLFIFFSTDHVYDGEFLNPNNIAQSTMHEDDGKQADDEMMQTGYSEQTPCYPLNNYGKSKLSMEDFLFSHWPNLVVLRCSVIYGPKNRVKDTLLQSVSKELGGNHNRKVVLFKNEFRNFVSISNVCKTVQRFVSRHFSDGVTQYHDVYNCGGFESFSRVEFGQKVAHIYGYDASKIDALTRLECKQKWANAAPNPQNCTMRTHKLQQELKGFCTFPSLLEQIESIKAQEEEEAFATK